MHFALDIENMSSQFFFTVSVAINTATAHKNRKYT